MFPITSYIDSVKTFIPKRVDLSNIPEAANTLFVEFIKLQEISDKEKIEETIYNTANLMVLLNIFEDTMVKDYDNEKVDVGTLYFNILSQLFNSMSELPENIQNELEYLLDDICLTVHSKRKATRIVRIPLISTDNTILIKCDTKEKIQKEWDIIQKIKEKCREFLIPYYNILDCQKNLCIFCIEKSNSIIIMKESGNTFINWIKNNHSYDEVYFEKLGKIFLDIIEALFCLHSNGYYHGDVKPENILVSEKDGLFKVQLIDFEKSGIRDINKTTKAGTREYKLRRESNVTTIDIQGIAIMIYMYFIIRTPGPYEFKKKVEKSLPGFDIRDRDIFTQIFSLDPKLEKLGWTVVGDFSMEYDALLVNYMNVLLGHTNEWYTKSDMPQTSL